MKTKKEVIHIIIFYLLTGVLVLGTAFVYYSGFNGMALLCAGITGAVATIPLYNSKEVSRKVADHLIQQHKLLDYEIGKLNLDNLLDGNPVMQRQSVSVSQ